MVWIFVFMILLLFAEVSIPGAWPEALAQPIRKLLWPFFIMFGGMLLYEWMLRLRIGRLLLKSKLPSCERKEFTLVGETVNLAARIEQATQPFDARLLISESIWDNLPQPPARSLDLELFEPRGISGPVRLFKLAQKAHQIARSISARRLTGGTRSPGFTRAGLARCRPKTTTPHCWQHRDQTREQSINAHSHACHGLPK